MNKPLRNDRLADQAGPVDPVRRGHLRRIFNLAAQLPDDWSGMMARTSLQEDFGAYRFQLAYMAYALALTHLHRLPAAPGYFRRPFQRLIEKMRSPDVWTYWHYVSTGNGPLNKAQGELPSEWNPVLKDNIMYSAYLQSMALLYHYLFNDDRYARTGALSLVFQPLFWGNEKRFEYDERSLNEHIYWSMVERGYLGIACEPNCVFQICNQVPILGFRLHDLVYGGDVAGEVTQGYLKAWSEFGVLNGNGHFNMMVMEEERVVVTPEAPWADFWLGSLMHAWNPDFVKTSFPRQMARWMRPGPDGTAWIVPPDSMVANEDLASARDFGWAAVCASEVGDTDTRDRLLAYADAYLHPRWTDGGYHYARHDRLYDPDGRFRCMDPHTGNALLAYARLNVPDGLRMLYDGPWDQRHFTEPALDELPETWDVTLARFDARNRQLVIRLENNGDSDDATLHFTGIWGRGDWCLYLDGETVASGGAEGVGQSTDGLTVTRADHKLILRLPARGPMDMVFKWQ